MELDIESWLMRAGRAQDVLQCIYEITEFSKGEYAPFFQNCGLYAVGSSLTSERPRDIDLVLVGLDFRAVADYDKVFLQDPETLIEKKIVISPELARRRGVTNPLSFMAGPRGLNSLWRPLPEAPNTRSRLNAGTDRKMLGDGNSAIEPELIKQDKLEDLDYVHQFMLGGIEYKGVYWAHNFQASMADSTALSLDNYCLRQGGPSKLVTDFHKAIASAFHKFNSWNLITPFETYFHDEEWYLTCRFPIHEESCPTVSGSDGKPCECKPLDIIVHTENLYVPYWKNHQRATNMPFFCLHEWPRADEISERSTITKLELPEFIDQEGKKRVKPHKYFLNFLRETPIDVS